MFNHDLLKRQSVGILSFIVLAGILIYALIFQPPNQIQTQTQQLSTETPTPVSNTSTSTSEPISPTPTALPTIAIEDSGDPFENIVKNILFQINQQDEIDQNLLDELNSGNYSIEKPLIVINPYNISPLTALVLFTSSEPLKISLHIDGLDELTDVNFTFDGFTKEHIIPIYGLYPDIANPVMISSIDENGNINQVSLILQTEPLPEELETIIFLTELRNKDQYNDGFNFTYVNGGKYPKAAFDADGTFRWFLNDAYAGSGLYTNKLFFVAKAISSEGHALVLEINPLGRIYKILYAPFGVHHDFIEYKNNMLVTGSDGETLEDIIYEVDLTTGQVRNYLDLKTVLQRSRQVAIVPLEHLDWFHNNAITWIEENKILISGRHQSALVKLSWPEGKIDWILASHQGWLPMFEKYLLTPIGDEFEWTYGQHAPEILPDQDKNPDTLDILVFDNGNNRFDMDDELQRQIRNNEIISPDLYSRIVQYRVNEKEMTIEQIWQFGKEFGGILYSAAHGDANLLSNGNRLTVFEVEPEPRTGTKTYATFFELTNQSEIIWSAQVISKKANGVHVEYRLTRMEIYNQSANDLQIGTPVINLIPEEILEQYGFQQ